MFRFYLKIFYFFSIWVEIRLILEIKLYERRFFRSLEWSKEVCFNERIKICVMQLRLCLQVIGRRLLEKVFKIQNMYDVQYNVEVNIIILCVMRLKVCWNMEVFFYFIFVYSFEFIFLFLVNFCFLLFEFVIFICFFLCNK